jgi:hypothetical protein
MGGSNISHVHETSYVDPVNKTVSMSSTNLTYNNLLSVKETVVYRPSRDDPAGKTEFKQDAKITAVCGGWDRVRSGVEDWAVERFGQNAKKGKEGFEAVLEMSRRAFGEQRDGQRQGI